MLFDIGAALIILHCFYKAFVSHQLDQTFVAPFLTGLAVVLVSGHVFNGIRHPPMLTGDEHGGVRFIMPNRRFQLQAEAYLMTGLYFGMVVGFILLVEGRRDNLARKGSGDTRTMIGCAAVALTYMGCMRASAIKSGY